MSKVTNRAEMLSENPVFNQDLSSWCVSGIASKPTKFDDDHRTGLTTPPGDLNGVHVRALLRPRLHRRPDDCMDTTNWERQIKTHNQ